MTLWALFWRFFFIGLFTIGGGQVAITLMYQELVDSGIIDAELFYNMLAVSESTPGPIGINNLFGNRNVRRVGRHYHDAGNCRAFNYCHFNHCTVFQPYAGYACG